MIVVSLLSLFVTNDETNVMLLPGYYHVSLKGATGGYGYNNPYGGPGATFEGILKITEDTHIRIVAGSYPGVSDGINPHRPGPFGEGGWGGGRDSAAGGGYSALFKNNNDTIVMVGGGGGAWKNQWGAPAGGFENGMSYVYNGNIKIYKWGTPAHHFGGNGSIISGGSGGGGGYFGGDAPYGSKGLGGSSYFNKDYFIRSQLYDGLRSSIPNVYGQIAIGEVYIRNDTICHKNCLSCKNYDGETCSICRPGKRLINMRCLDSCDEINSSTYTDSDNTCKPCMKNCEKCTNGTFCTHCKSGYHFDGTKCAIRDVNVNISIDKDNSHSGAQRINKSNEPKHDKPFPWWIIGVVCGAVLIIVVLIIVVYKKKKETSTTEMAEESIEETNNMTTATSVTVDNPLYFDSTSQEADPFHNDFEEDYEVSKVFESPFIEDNIVDDE